MPVNSRLLYIFIPILDKVYKAAKSHNWPAIRLTDFSSTVLIPNSAYCFCILHYFFCTMASCPRRLPFHVLPNFTSPCKNNPCVPKSVLIIIHTIIKLLLPDTRRFVLLAHSIIVPTVGFHQRKLAKPSKRFCNLRSFQPYHFKAS